VGYKKFFNWVVTGQSETQFYSVLVNNPHTHRPVNTPVKSFVAFNNKLILKWIAAYFITYLQCCLNGSTYHSCSARSWRK